MIENNSLNNEQIKAITTQSQYVRVIAGAGSGKTLVLIHRIIYLMTQLQVDPNRILALTYTNKAANEMQSRILKFPLLKNINVSLQISTFHSFCLKFLREEITFLKINPYFTIFDREDTKKVISDINKKNNFNFNVKDVITYISNKKQKSHYYDFFEKEKDYLFIFDEYEKFKIKNNVLDFDDLIIKTIEILSLSTEIREKWSKLIGYILVDEFQDTNDIQFELIKLISNDSTSIYVVGDPDQTIYTWRGANQTNIIDFDKNYNNVETIFLNQNYRSTKKILDVANKLIAYNTGFFDQKKLLTNNIDGDDVSLFLGFQDDDINESEHVASEIIQLNNQKVDFKNIAILYRSSYLAVPFEKELTKNNIPYRVFGGISFFQRQEIKDVLSYFRLFFNHKDDIAFERIINVPKRKIGKKSIEIIKSQSINTSFYDFIKEIKNNPKKEIKISKKIIDNLFELIQIIEKVKSDLTNDKKNTIQILKNFLHQVGYFEYLKKNDISNDKTNNLELLFENIDETIKKADYDLNFWLQNCMLNTSQDEIKDGEFVSLMTIHTAKGLEFDYVFVVGLNKFDFPHVKSYDSLEEERRLCYVAYTRAKKKLFISAKSNDLASCFIKESGFEIKDSSHNECLHYFQKNNIDNILYSYKYEKEDNIKEETASNGISDWRVNDKVIHERFGHGVVIEVLEDNIIVVKFDNYGTKKMIATHIMLKRIYD